MGFDIFIALFYLLIWVSTIAVLRLKKKKSFVYLFFFTVFSIYLFKVLDYTLFQFQSLLLLKYFMPHLILNGQTAGEAVNLIPLIALSTEDLKTSFLNVLLFVPFGFGLPFITNYFIKKIVIMGALFSILIELLQFLTGYIAKITFRIADINDILFNTMGVVIGYILFVGFVRLCRYSAHKSTNPIVRSIIDRPQVK